MSLAPNQWDQYRRNDGTIDLYECFQAQYPHETYTSHNGQQFARLYFDNIQSLQRINSRQAAAVAITTCAMLIRIHYK